MPREEIYEATKKVYALYGAFFKFVTQEIGLEKALALHVKAHEEQGVVSGVALKKRLGEKHDINLLGSVLQTSNLSIGIECDLAEASSSGVLFHNKQCPLYDGYRQGGLDDATAETLCQLGAPAKLGTMLRILDPGITYRLKYYRSEPAEACEEQIGNLPEVE